ncbi:MAG: hypothetical protein M3285_05715 [Actinomycetota bacterium]|nr:hypothetical protein [Actinomycetota bacterium]
MTRTPEVNRRGRLARLVVVTMAASLFLTVPAVADKDDLVNVHRMGPIKRDVTTYKQFKNWFGPPTSVDRHPYQCIDVIDAVWKGRFRMFFNEDTKTAVVAILRKRSVVSDRHGLLQFHTRKGLRVGDRARRVQHLYPRADKHEHPDKNHWILVSGDRGRLEATTAGREVTELRVFPFEAC